MIRKALRTIALTSLALVGTLAAMWQAQAQEAKAPYPSMAPLERNAEIALARSAAPPSISQDAEIMVLGQHSYKTAIKGKNGFVCMVWRSWTAGTDDPEFWNSKLRAPICFNSAAARSQVPQTIRENRSNIGFAIERPDVRGYQRRFRQEGIAAAGTGCDVLHDVEATVLERP